MRIFRRGVAGVNEGYLDTHYAQRASATAPLPEDDGRKPGDQQAWTPEQRHTLTRHVDEQAREAIETYTGLPEDVDSRDKQRVRYAALKTARDRALVFVLAYTAVRVGELLRDPDDPRRRGVRWEDLSLDDGSMDVYRKKQQWDAASLPDPVISPLRSYRKLMAPPTERWPMFPTFDQWTLAGLVQESSPTKGNAQKQLLSAVRSTLATSCYRSMRTFGRRRSQWTAHG